MEGAYLAEVSRAKQLLDSVELKPCPWCGERPVTVFSYDLETKGFTVVGFEITCTSCEMCPTTFFRETIDGAIKSWQERNTK